MEHFGDIAPFSRNQTPIDGSHTNPLGAAPSKMTNSRVPPDGNTLHMYFSNQNIKRTYRGKSSHDVNDYEMNLSSLKNSTAAFDTSHKDLNTIKRFSSQSKDEVADLQVFGRNSSVGTKKQGTLYRDPEQSPTLISEPRKNLQKAE